MNERDQDAAMRALFATPDTPGDSPAFVAGVVKRVKADRERSRLRVQAASVTLAAVGGVSSIPYLGAISQTLVSAWAKAMPAMPAMSAGTASLIMVIAACGAAYFVAERA